MLTFLASILLIASAPMESASTGKLPAPTLGALVAIQPAGVIINWEPVISDEVQGYKVKLWEAKAIKTYNYKSVNGEIVEEIKKPESIKFTPRDGELHEYVITGAQQSRLVVNGLQLDTPYLVQVLGISARGASEPSSVLGLELLSSNATSTTMRDEQKISYQSFYRLGK